MVTPFSSVPPFLPVGEVSSGLYRRMGARKALSPFPGWVLARRMVMPESVALENHLKPLMLHGPRGMPVSLSARGV